ncbi:MAG: sugar phosphate isomerase/epimerase family protein [Rhodospirillales bacterium]
MPDQSAEATLKYCIDSGISAIELMGDPVNDWARKKGKWDSSPAAAAAAAAAESMRAGGRRGAGIRPPGGPSRQAPSYAPVAGMKTGWGNDQPAGQWNGQACPEQRPAAPAKPAGSRPPRREPTPEQKAAVEAERKWRLGLSMDIFKELRKLYNDAGVSIYAVKDVRQETEEDLEYTFTVARALGASHVTIELPSGPDAAAMLKRLGDAALKHKMFVAYHTHAQGSMTAFDEAFSISKGNMANIDLGHFLANPDAGGTPMDFLKKFHARTSSFHIKDRTTVNHCALNLPWGHGETPIKEILQLVSKNRWRIPATIELEYTIPEGSDAVKEVARCLEYCRKVL